MSWSVPGAVCRRVLLAALLLLGDIEMAMAGDTSIRIDAGAVHVEFTDEDSEYRIDYRGQGDCEPELAIVETAEAVVVSHTRSCHGHGRGEGTIIMLRLSSARSHLIRLGAGGLYFHGMALAGYRDFEGRVSIGGINVGEHALPFPLTRRQLLGARSNFFNPDGRGKIVAQVKYGAINIE